MFNNEKMPGFFAKDKDQKKQILVHHYQDRDNFLVQMKTASAKDEIFLLKSDEKYLAEDVMEKVKKINSPGEKLGNEDSFQMPKVSIKNKRQVKELIGQPLANEAFTDYVIV